MAKVTAKMKGESRVITGVVRLSFSNLFEPRKTDDGKPGKYDCCLLIDKEDTDTVKCINKAIENAKAKGVKEKWGNKVPKNLVLPFHDGDEKEDDQYSDQFKGMMFLNPKAKSRPSIVDKHCAPIIDPEELYSGCYIIAALSFFPYDAQGNRGVGVGIDNVMKWRDGESLAGRPSAESDFEGFGGDDDDDDDI